jgi:rhamnosyltransferase
MKMACVTIVYHPDEKVLVNLGSYKSFPEVLVIDNSEAQPNGFARALSDIPHVKYFHDGNNKGIGARLNQACQLAIGAGCQWLLTMDQDSFFDPVLLGSGYVWSSLRKSDR